MGGRSSGLLVFCLFATIAGCGSSSSSSSSSGSGGSGGCDTKSLTCGQAAATADLTAIFGAALTTYDESGHPNCNIGLAAGGGGIQVFCAQDYGSLLSGAKASYPSTTEPNTTGTKSFEVETADVVEVGFVTTSGKYAVLVNLVTAAADIAKARVLAQKVDQNLSAL
jgi:hypothetical protein